VTKDRVGAGLAVLAAIIGLVLVFQFPQSPGDGDDDDAPAAPPTSQIAPAPGGVLPPGQVQPAPGQVQQPQAPAQQPDNDGDDDG
jgi:hypothetical protein